MESKDDQLETILIYVTTNSETEAASIARNLVEQGLCACVNIIPQVRSIYSYNGKINDDSEVMMIIKSTKNLYSSLEKRILSIHSYEVPEIISVDIARGNDRFISWIGESVKKNEGDK